MHFRGNSNIDDNDIFSTNIERILNYDKFYYDQVSRIYFNFIFLLTTFNSSYLISLLTPLPTNAFLSPKLYTPT